MSDWLFRWRWPRVAALTLFMTVLWCGNPVGAESGPQPPCGAEPLPPFPTPDASPMVRVWNSSDLRDWKPPVCTGWSASDSPTIVAVAARFRFTGGIDGLRRRIG